MEEIRLPKIGAGRLDHLALSEVCQEILSADHNALRARQEYSINLQVAPTQCCNLRQQ